MYSVKHQVNGLNRLYANQIADCPLYKIENSTFSLFLWLIHKDLLHIYIYKNSTFLLFIMVNPQRYVTHTFRVKLFPLPGLLSFVVLQVKKEHFVSCIIPIQTTEDISRFHPS